MNVHPANSREEYRRVLAGFIGAFKDKEPWWHAILGRVDAHDTTRSLPEMIGLSKETALSFFEGAGLVSYRRRKESEPVQLFVEEKNWQSFIKEHHLGQFMEFTRFVVGGKGRHLINLGDRRKGLHLPRHQYCKDLKKRLTEHPTFRVSYQQRAALRNSISDATTNFLLRRAIHEKEKALDNQHEAQEESKQDDATQTRETSTLRTDKTEGFIYVDKEKAPILSKLCDEENKMSIGNYNKLLSELMALDNQSDKSIDFVHHSN
jgi:hypothetical protein